MYRPQITAKNVTPSATAEGKGPARKLILKAANDNRASLSYYLQKIMFIMAPISALAFFAIVWWLK